ncbi:MAG: hypothetical protein ACKVPX_12465 [Myxococcaceae bacterium]
MTLHIALVAWVLAGASPLKLRELPAREFHPSRGETVSLPFSLETPCEVGAEIFTGDGDGVRKLTAKIPFAAKNKALVWDGKDDLGQVVPDEAYHAVWTYRCGGVEGVLDERRTSGGIPLEPLPLSVSGDGNLTLNLPAPARVLVRVGIKGGAMLRALHLWAPSTKGTLRIAWNGIDASGVERLVGTPGLVFMARAFSLPNQTLLTSGNTALTYFDYRQKRRFPVPKASLADKTLVRDGKRIAREALIPVSLLRDPRVRLSLAQPAKTTSSGESVVKGPVTFRVEVPREDQWLVEQSLYEVSFFLDGQFVSEEETGYTPLSWRWDPKGVTKGRHVMTVNVAGFWGHVGVASVALWVEP